jgi:hypothetical protein
VSKLFGLFLFWLGVMFFIGVIGTVQVTWINKFGLVHGLVLAPILFLLSFGALLSAFRRFGKKPLHVVMKESATLDVIDTEWVGDDSQEQRKKRAVTIDAIEAEWTDNGGKQEQNKKNTKKVLLTQFAILTLSVVAQLLGHG